LLERSNIVINAGYVRVEEVSMYFSLGTHRKRVPIKKITGKKWINRSEMLYRPTA
jgi:hypothetical protein